MNPWYMLIFGYLVTVLIETPILLLGLSRRHSWQRRLFAGLWLTACTYPVVVLVIPQLYDPTTARAAYLAVAETFAPVVECLLFWIAFIKSHPSDRRATFQDLGVIVLANLASFLSGELLYQSAFFRSLLERWQGS